MVQFCALLSWLRMIWTWGLGVLSLRASHMSCPVLETLTSASFGIDHRTTNVQRQLDMPRTSCAGYT